MGAIAEPAQAQCFEGLREVAELYAAQATRVRRLVHLHVTAPDVVVEDACQVAWLRLVRHRARVRRESADRWLVRVAVHEALRAVARGARDVSLDTIGDGYGHGHGDGGGDRARRGDREPRSAPDLMDGLAEGRERLRAIGELSERQQRLVWLQGLGFSYEEMAGATGDSRRTVERQLLRAREALAGL